MFALELLVLTCVLGTITECKMSCKNESNEYVDWIIALKPPGVSSFSYVSSQTIGSNWVLSKKDLLSSRNLIAFTLSQAYESRDSGSVYAFYNDEKPFEQKLSWSTRGHLKGIINFDKDNGYWMIHSVPKFPYENEYQYGHSELRYGQSFICVSLGVDSLGPIVNQLLMMQSTVYSYNLPNDFSSNRILMNKLNSFVSNRDVTKDRMHVLNLKTQNKVGVTHFGKSSFLNNDLYEAVMAPYLKSSLFVESWIRGEKVHSSCDSPYKVYNVKYVNFNGEKYKETRDHSKWAVSKTAENPFVCIGSINRMTSQFKRGGGSMCLFKREIWQLFTKMVESYEHCEEK